jgi:hypothetical protein
MNATCPTNLNFFVLITLLHSKEQTSWLIDSNLLHTHTTSLHQNMLAVVNGIKYEGHKHMWFCENNLKV